jgi:hypothetical protein
MYHESYVGPDNDGRMLQRKKFYKEEFLSVKSGCYNEQRCYNERGGILSASVDARAHNVSGLPALIRASVINFIIICKVQLSFSSVICLFVQCIKVK